MRMHVSCDGDLFVGKRGAFSTPCTGSPSIIANPKSIIFTSKSLVPQRLHQVTMADACCTMRRLFATFFRPRAYVKDVFLRRLITSYQQPFRKVRLVPHWSRVGRIGFVMRSCKRLQHWHVLSPHVPNSIPFYAIPCRPISMDSGLAA